MMIDDCYLDARATLFFAPGIVSQSVGVSSVCRTFARPFRPPIANVGGNVHVAHVYVATSLWPFILEKAHESCMSAHRINDLCSRHVASLRLTLEMHAPFTHMRRISLPPSADRFVPPRCALPALSCAAATF